MCQPNEICAVENGVWFVKKYSKKIQMYNWLKWKIFFVFRQKNVRCQTKSTEWFAAKEETNFNGWSYFQN